MLHIPPKDMSFKAVRARLRNPPNAVPDLGIDLRNPRKLSDLAPPDLTPVIELVDQPPPSWSVVPNDRQLPEKVSIRDIQDAVCKEFGVLLSDLLGPRRPPVLALPRQVGMYLSRILAFRSTPEIGRMFGGRDHTTVIHGIRKIETLMQSDQELASRIEALKWSITNPYLCQLRCVVQTSLEPRQCNWHVNITTSTQQ